MSMFFRYDGDLSFENETKAKEYHKMLVDHPDSWFYLFPEDTELNGAKISRWFSESR